MKKLFSLVVIIILLFGCTHYYSTATQPQDENIINAPIDIVWEKTLQILPTERISLKIIDKKNYFIFGEKHITIWSWGDNINIHLIPLGDNQTIMQFEAGAKAQLYDWGHEKRMVKDIFTKIKIASEAN